jgi:hypothetical protein
MMDRYFQLLFKLPTLLRHAWRLREARLRGMTPVFLPPLGLMRLGEAADQVRADFETWYPTMLNICRAPDGVPTADPDSIFPSVLAYANPWMGSGMYYLDSHFAPFYILHLQSTGTTNVTKGQEPLVLYPSEKPLTLQYIWATTLRC